MTNKARRNRQRRSRQGQLEQQEQGRPRLKATSALWSMAPAEEHHLSIKPARCSNTPKTVEEPNPSIPRSEDPLSEPTRDAVTDRPGTLSSGESTGLEEVAEPKAGDKFLGPGGERYGISETGFLWHVSPNSSCGGLLVSPSEVPWKIKALGLIKLPESDFILSRFSDKDRFIDLDGREYHIKVVNEKNIWYSGIFLMIADCGMGHNAPCFWREEDLARYMEEQHIYRMEREGSGKSYENYIMPFHSLSKDRPSTYRLYGITSEGERVMLMVGSLESCIAEQARRHGKTGFIYSIRGSSRGHKLIRNEIKTREEKVLRTATHQEIRSELLRRLRIEDGVEITDNRSKVYRIVATGNMFKLLDKDGKCLALKPEAEMLDYIRTNIGLYNITRSKQAEWTLLQNVVVGAAAAIGVIGLIILMITFAANRHNPSSGQPDAGANPPAAVQNQADAGDRD